MPFNIKSHDGEIGITEWDWEFENLLEVEEDGFSVKVSIRDDEQIAKEIQATFVEIFGERGICAYLNTELESFARDPLSVEVGLPIAANDFDHVWFNVSFYDTVLEWLSARSERRSSEEVSQDNDVINKIIVRLEDLIKVLKGAQ